MSPTTKRRFILKLGIKKKTVLFGWFKHTKYSDYAFYLISYFWKNPPHYVNVAAYKEAAAEIALAHKQAAKKRNENQKVSKTLAVNKAKELYTLVNDIKVMQNETMDQLEEQGGTIMKIEDKLEVLDENLKRADHLMKGIESAPYYIFGGITKIEVLEKPEKKKKVMISNKIEVLEKKKRPYKTSRRQSPFCRN